MLELKVAAVQSFALLINNFRAAQSRPDQQRRDVGMVRPGQAGPAEWAGKRIKY